MATKNYRILVYLLILILMMSVACTKQDSPKSGDLRFYRVGGQKGIIERFGTNVYETFNELDVHKDAFDRFLFTIAEEPLTEKQIVEKSTLSSSQVMNFISTLDSINVVKKDEQGRWATTVPVITDRQMKVIRKDLTPMANSVAQYLKKEVHQLKTLYNEVKLPHDPPWEDMTHLIIDKLIIDGTFHSKMNRLKREKEARETDDQYQYMIPAFFLEHGENFSNFGTNWYGFPKNDDQRDVFVLHGALFDRSVIAMNKYRGDENFGSALFKISPEGSIASLTEQEKDMLRYLKWTAEDRLLVPIVHANTLKSLWSTMEKIGNDAAEVAFEHFSDIVESFNNSPYSKFCEGNSDYIQVCYHALFGITIEQLVENGIVSPIPEPVPEHLGVYFVFGDLY